MNWRPRLKKRSTAEMTDRRRKEKTVKQIQKEIEKLKDEYKKMELRPCHSDADLVKRDKDLDLLNDKICSFEKERDTYLCSSRRH